MRAVHARDTWIDDAAPTVSTHSFHAGRSGEPLVTPRLAEWDLPRAAPRRPSKVLSRVLSFCGWTLAAATLVGVYTNVIADDATLRQRTNEIARQHAGCADTCKVGEMQGRRTVLAYDVDYEIEQVGKVHVTCRRSAVILGDHSCVVQTLGAR